jgi:hypothetical protein
VFIEVYKIYKRDFLPTNAINEVENVRHYHILEKENRLSLFDTINYHTIERSK